MPESAPPKDAIRLGPGKWIEFIDLTDRHETAQNIDELLADLEPMWSALETNCVAGCCGLDAFDFSPAAIKEFADNYRDAALICADLDRLRSALKVLPATAYVSSRLNNYCDQSVFDSLLAHLREQFSACAATADTTDAKSDSGKQ